MGFAAEHFRTFARYNEWANERLYAACASLPMAEYRAPRPAFFRGLHGTLNHVLVGDRLWLGRLDGSGNPGIKALNQILYDDLAGLHVARRAEDARILRFIGSLDDADYEREVEYRNFAGAAHRNPLGRLLAHFFNHQTHHRGQAHDQLSQTSVPPPELDLIYFMRETAK